MGGGREDGGRDGGWGEGGGEGGWGGGQMIFSKKKLEDKKSWYVKMERVLKTGI